MRVHGMFIFNDALCLLFIQSTTHPAYLADGTRVPIFTGFRIRACTRWRGKPRDGTVETMEPIPVLALWSAPRCRSTAFARMMAERGDRVVVHEPFSQVVDFGEVKVGDRVARTEHDVLAALRAMAADKPVFFKDTTDFHYPALLADQAFLAAATHTFIIRHPAEA